MPSNGNSAEAVVYVLELAKAENRSLSNFIENVLKTEVAKHESKQRHTKTD